MKIVLNDFYMHAKISQHSNLNIYIYVYRALSKHTTMYQVYQLTSLCVACMHACTYAHMHTHTTRTHAHTHTHKHTSMNTRTSTHPATPVHAHISFFHWTCFLQTKVVTNCFCRTFGEASSQSFVVIIQLEICWNSFAKFSSMQTHCSLHQRPFSIGCPQSVASFSVFTIWGFQPVPSLTTAHPETTQCGWWDVKIPELTD